MTYPRIIPRDLFNEANLLKCYGQLALLELEGLLPQLKIEHDGEPFQIEMDPSDGSLYIDNIKLIFNGVPLPVSRPLNSRNSWPLYCTVTGNPIFDEKGNFIYEAVQE